MEPDVPAPSHNTKGEDMKNQNGATSMRLTRLQEFIQFCCIDCKAIQFGELTLKSGRTSPYFFNSGKFCTGAATQKLAQAYVLKIMGEKMEFDMMYGPAYKGIPLAVAAAEAYDRETGYETSWAFDRKEEKTHGEGGSIVGAPISGQVLLLDDVSTNGATKRESAELIKYHGGQLAGIVLALDRQERGKDSDLSAVQELERDLAVPVRVVITLDDLIEYIESLDPDMILSHHNKDGSPVTAHWAFNEIGMYRDKYGV